MIINKPWLESEKKMLEDRDKDTQAYVGAIFKVGEKVLELLEALGDKEIDADVLITQANEELQEGITGNQATFVAMITINCHSRGEEFRKSWNKSNGNEFSKGIINPAVLNIK
jgi:hypothetical protein